jgi:hypothetical protein
MVSKKPHRNPDKMGCAAIRMGEVLEDWRRAGRKDRQDGNERNRASGLNRAGRRNNSQPEQNPDRSKQDREIGAGAGERRDQHGRQTQIDDETLKWPRHMPWVQNVILLDGGRILGGGFVLEKCPF